MTYYDDFSLLKEGPISSERIVAIGWLDSGHRFQRGRAQPSFVQSLRRAIERCWQPFISPGIHFCELCPSGRISGSGTLWIPGIVEIFVSPELILHYVEAHDYVPPEKYVASVVACPEMNSPAYFAELARLGVLGRAPPWAK